MQTITFWRQPGNKTMKRVDLDGSQHVPTERAFREMNQLRADGWRISDQPHKVVLTK